MGEPKFSNEGVWSSGRGPLSVYLWENARVYAEQALGSRFIQGIQNGNLTQEEFGRYMLQDSVFYYNVKHNIEIAQKRATDPSVKAFLEARSETYKELYEKLCDTWNIEDPKKITLGDSCMAYIAHENNVVSSYDPIYFIVALTPCVKLWPWIGQQIGVSDHADFGLYTDWMKRNFNPTYNGAAKYESLIDDAENMGHIDRQTALQVYTASMKGEADFFTSVRAY